jgi:hypothetical protein
MSKGGVCPFLDGNSDNYFIKFEILNKLLSFPFMEVYKVGIRYILY